MADRQGGALLQLRKLLETHAAKELTDGQLLARYAAQRDDCAFAALMQRHGPLVYGVCRHVLGHEHDAEDAFQGTFLVLARKAGTIRRQNSVAGWLHGVAYRLSLKARQSAGRRRRHESRTARPDVDNPPSHEGWRELQALLDQELERLPEKYRTPFVLCVLEGKTKPEAARQLLWREGTVSSRLAKARKLLQMRLSRRGVELSAVLCGLAVAEKSAEAAVPVALTSSTLQASAAFGFGAGQAIAEGAASAHAVALADGLLRSMAFSRFKHGLAIVLLLVLVGSSTAFYFWQAPEGEPPSPAPPPNLPAEVPQPKDLEPIGEGGGQMLVRGQVKGPDDKAVAGADVAIIADEGRAAGDRAFNVFTRRKLVASGRADADGRFVLSVRRPVVGKSQNMYCLARGDGQAVVWQSLQTLVEIPDLVLTLEAGQELRGRLAPSPTPMASLF